MIRLFGFAIAGLLALAQPLNAAGTIPGFSLTPQFDEFGKVMPNCKLYVIQASTTQTPQNSYQDSSLTILQPNPLSCDATGRLPQFFVADGVIKVRLTNAAGSQKFVGDNLLVVGSSSGGGGGGTVDPTTIIATGDIKARYGTGVLAGFVRLNGRTMGSATSGATERANSDTQALFEYLWQTDANLAVSTGRGASANADWVANKTIALPDARSRALAGLGDMGNSDNALFSGVTFTSGNSTTLGSPLGAARRTLTTPQLPVTNFNGILGVTVPATTLTVRYGVRNNTNSAGVTDPSNLALANDGNAIAGTLNAAAATFPSTAASISGSFGSGAAHDTVSPFLLITVYQKL